jgi:hypothetical protein
MQNNKESVIIFGVEYIPKDSSSQTAGIQAVPQSKYDKALNIYESFLKENNLNLKPLPYKDPDDDDEKNTNAYQMIKNIVKFENGGKIPDWSNESPYKYYPWFKKDKSGFGLSCSDFGRWSSDSSVPARLCSLDSKNVKPIAEKYLPIYNILQIK